MCKICDDYYAEGGCTCIGEDEITFGRSSLTMDMWLINGRLHSYLTDFSNSTVMDVATQIGYCPFCGDKLKEINED